jgi:superfamily I DNA/RNA helicase
MGKHAESVELLLGRLSDAQRPAATDEGHTVIVAGPGSGKTTTMVAKAVYLADKYGPENVAMVTFTRNATAEMKARVSRAIGKAAMDAMQISTLHVAMSGTLPNDQRTRNRKRLKPGEAASLLYSVIGAVAKNRHYCKKEDVANAVTRLRSCYPQPLAPLSDSPIDTLAYDVLLAYQDMLQKQSLGDMDQMLKESVESLVSGVSRPLERKFLIVDEYQDTDETQHEWVKIHASSGLMTTIVGDDDQSIYAFRGSIGYRSMTDFMGSFEHRRYDIVTTYRTAPLIMGAALRMVGHNKERLEKRIESGADAGPGMVELRVYAKGCHVLAMRLAPDGTGYYDLISGDSVADDLPGDLPGDYDPDALDAARAAGGASAAILEACGAVDRISALMRYGGGSGAILAKTNFQLGALEARARELGITFYRSGAGSFLDKSYVAETVALIRMGYEPPSPRSIGMVLSLLNFSDHNIAIIIKVMSDYGSACDPFSFLFDSGMFSRLDSLDDATKLRALRDRLEAWADIAITRGRCLTRQMCEEVSGHIMGLSDFIISMQNDRGSRSRHIAFMCDFIANRVDGALAERVRKAQFIFGRDPNKSGPGKDDLYLGTIHSAKGMEFDYVWMLRCNESPDDGESLQGDLLPGDSGIEESRRVSYVGMTRAKSHLFMSAVSTARQKTLSRMVFECLKPSQPKRGLHPVDELQE